LGSFDRALFTQGTTLLTECWPLTFRVMWVGSDRILGSCDGVLGSFDGILGSFDGILGSFDRSYVGGG